MLLSTKLHKPCLPQGFLSRTHPLQALDEAADKRVCLVCAPAGYGKTTLLVDWLEQRRRKAAWLSLEASENEPFAFWFGVCSALGQLDSRFFERVWPQFSEAGNDPWPGIHSLLSELQAYSRSWAADRRLYLVLDDFHVLDNADLHASFDWFLDHTPDLLRVILASRIQPGLSLARRRMAGHCQILTESALRFDQGDVEHLLADTFHLSLSADQVQQILARTEGWAAALQLTALAWQENGSNTPAAQRLDPEPQALSDYLMAEIFQRQPQSVQAFLTRIARLPRFSAALCDAVLQEQDGNAMLDYLVRHNLLIQPLDEQRHWYRLHDLLRDWLQSLPLPAPEEKDIRRRAALWLQDQGDSFEAFEQWIALKAWPEAARLVTLHFLAWWQQGLLPRAESGLRQFPGDWQTANPWLRYLEAFILFQRGELTNASQALHEAEHRFRNAPYWAPAEETLFNTKEGLPEAVLAEFPLHLASLRAHIARLHGDIETAITLSQELEQTTSLSDSPLLDWTLCGCCTDHFFRLNPPLARDYGIRALHRARRNHNASCQVVTLAWLVTTLVHQGEAREALAWIERTQQEIGPGWEANAWAPSIPHQRAVVLREQNQLEAATEWLDHAFAMVTERLMPQVLIYFEFLRWQLALNRGDFETAQAAIDRIQHWHYQQDGQTWHYATLEPDLMHALLRAAQGQAEPLLAWAQSFDPTPPPTPNWQHFAKLAIWLRVQVDLGQDITEPLARFREQADAGGIVVWQVKAALLEHHQFQHRAPKATKAAMHRALHLSIKHDQLRTFLDDGPGLVPGLRDCLDDRPVAKEAARILTAMGVEVPLPTQASESLTDRERQVLASLESGKSNPELARELNVSLSTVKAHLRNIFAKLGVRNRTQAITRARKFGLQVNAKT